MLNNHAYNLVEQLAQEHKSLWRVRNEYATDAEGCEQCLAWWKKMTDDKESHIAELLAMIKSHLT
ncbi:MAG: hypothetical protein AAB539_01005 [Patescibacteria group bacterium]